MRTTLGAILATTRPENRRKYIRALDLFLSGSHGSITHIAKESNLKEVTLTKFLRDKIMPLVKWSPKIIPPRDLGFQTFLVQLKPDTDHYLELLDSLGACAPVRFMWSDLSDHLFLLLVCDEETVRDVKASLRGKADINYLSPVDIKKISHLTPTEVVS